MKSYILLIMATILICSNKIKCQAPETNVEIKKENASIIAQKIMEEDFYYDVVDEFSPFGNDVGNDTFYLYNDWGKKHPSKTAKDFLDSTMKNLGFSSFDMMVIDKKRLDIILEKLPNKYLDLNTIDNTIISLAFSQLFLKGKIEGNIKELFKIAINRELMFIDFWGENANIREKRFQKMLTDLNKLTE